MTRKIPGIKIQYFQESQYPIVDGQRCVKILIPDDDAFLPALAGVMALLTKGFNYQRADYDRAQIIANMWRAAYDNTDWNQCMTCEEVQDCIENDEGVRNALQTFVDHQIEEKLDSNTPGTKPSSERLNENAAGDNPGCDNDVAWGRIRGGLIERSFQRVIDFLEQVQVTTNNQDMLSDALNSIPVLGEVLGVVGVASWISFYDDIRDWLADAFVAQDTTDLRDQIGCDLFCIWQENCSLSVQQIRDYYVGKLTPDFPSLAEALAGGIIELAAALGELIEDVSSFAVYIMLAAEYGFQAEINDWFGVTIQAAKSDLLVGEPSSDWMTLCDPCGGTWTRTLLTSAGDGGFMATGGFGSYSGGVWNGTCINAGLYYGAAIIELTIDSAQITSIEATYTITDFEFVGATDDGVYLSSGYVATQASGDGTDRVLHADTDEPSSVLGVNINYGNRAGSCPGGTGYITQVVITGTGDIPPQLDINGWA